MSPGIDAGAGRGPVLGTHGMVASEHPLVSQTGVDVLRRGGNAFDAALAMSAVLPVVKPHRNHLGGDAYVLAYPRGEGRVTAICSGGKAPAGATLERYAGGSRGTGAPPRRSRGWSTRGRRSTRDGARGHGRSCCSRPSGMRGRGFP